MHIETIQLQNVGVFAGIQEIDLRVKTAKRPVVLIGGLNGCGKTTLLESILLALYGKLSPAARNARASYESYLESLMTTGADGASAVAAMLFTRAAVFFGMPAAVVGESEPCIVQRHSARQSPSEVHSGGATSVDAVVSAY